MSTNDDSPNPEPDRILPFDGPDEFPPLSALVAVDFGAASRPGTNRSVNEDHYFVLKLGRHQETLLSSLTDPSVLEPFKEYAYGIVVADGMNGPNSAGELASRLALVTLHHLIQRFGRWNLRVDTRIAAEIMARAERFYRRVDATLLDRNVTHFGGAVRQVHAIAPRVPLVVLTGLDEIDTLEARPVPFDLCVSVQKFPVTAGLHFESNDVERGHGSAPRCEAGPIS